MKTLVKRIKAQLQGDTTITPYVATTSMQIVSPDMLPDIAITATPFIGIAPVSTTEGWFSTGKMNLIHTVRIFIVQSFEVQETAIIGDSVKPSIFELTDLVKDSVRAEFFASGGVNWLSKPAVITNTRYSTPPMGDNYYVFVSAIDLACARQIDVTV